MDYGNEIRKHYYLPKTVIIAPKRAARPTSFTESIEVNGAKKCVLCNNHEEPVYSVESNESWLIKSVHNPYGALSAHQKSAYGIQEVIIESPNHVTRFSDHSVSTIKSILDMYANRSDALKSKQHIRYVSIFKNNGPHAGATLQHAHSQVYAFPFIPEKVQAEAAAQIQYKKKHQRCAVCDIATTESEDKIRVICESENAIAICPFASEYSYEVMIIPKKHTVSLSKTTDSTRYDIAFILKACLKFLEDMPYDYNFYINDMHSAGTHTYIRITPRVGAPKVVAGLEIATDIAVNSVAPERAASEYRQLVHSQLSAQHYATAK